MCIVQIIKTAFIQNLFATLIGAFVGFLLAFTANARGAKRTRQRRERTFLRTLEAALIDEKATVQHILENPNDAWVTPLNLTLLESTASAKYEIIDDLELNGKLDDVLFVLTQISDLVQMYQQSAIAPSPLGQPPYIGMGVIRGAIIAACDTARKPIDEALEKITNILEGATTTH